MGSGEGRGRMHDQYGSRELSRSSFFQSQGDGLISMDLWKLNGNLQKHNLGSIHLGESLSLLAVLNNESTEVMSNVFIQIELQTGTQRSTLYKTTDAISVNYRESSESMINMEVKELGVHVISCQVTFKTDSIASNPPKSFRKYFKFTSISPFQLKTKVNEDLPDRIFVQAQLMNCSSAMSQFLIEELRFIPGSSFSAHKPFQDLDSSLSKLSMNEENSFVELEESIAYKNEVILHPRHAHFFVFELCPLKDTEPSENLGRLDIKWKTQSGESGHLQTGNILRKQILSESHVLECKLLGKSLQLFTISELELLVANKSSRQIENIEFGIDSESWTSSSVFTPCGNDKISITLLKSGESKVIKFRVIPVQSGILTSKDFWLKYVDNAVQHHVPKEFAFFVEYKKT